MSSKESSTGQPMSVFNLAELAKLGQRQSDAFQQMRMELFGFVEQAGREWVARVELERDMTINLAARLSSAKTLPDTATAYQEWLAGHLAALTEDGRKFLVNSQKLVASTTRMVANGGHSAVK